MIWCGAHAHGLKFKTFPAGVTMDSNLYIETIQWYHNELINDGFSEEYLSRYRIMPGFLYLEWRTVLYFFLKADRRYRPDSFCIVIFGFELKQN